MVRSERRPGWLSLPEAAHAVPMSLPALRYVARHLAGPLEVRLDERGTAFIPASKLPLLRRVAAYRAQGHTIEQIKGLLRSEGAALPARAARPAERAHHQPAARPRPVPGLGQAFSSPSAPSPPEALSLPFPFPAAARANGRGGSQGSSPKRRPVLGRPTVSFRRTPSSSFERRSPPSTGSSRSCGCGWSGSCFCFKNSRWAWRLSPCPGPRPRLWASGQLPAGPGRRRGSPMGEAWRWKGWPLRRPGRGGAPAHADPFQPTAPGGGPALAPAGLERDPVRPLG